MPRCRLVCSPKTGKCVVRSRSRCKSKALKSYKKCLKKCIRKRSSKCDPCFGDTSSVIYTKPVVCCIKKRSCRKLKRSCRKRSRC